jgi:hypothetical protein
MKRIIILSVFIIVTAVAALAQDAQQKSGSKAANAQTVAATPTVEQILNRYVEALGGRAAIEKLNSREARGSFEIAGTPLKGTVEAYNKAPNKMANFTRVPGLGDLFEGYDGTISWTLDPTNGLRERSGMELVQSKFDSEFYKEIKLKEFYAKMEVKGTEKINGREAYRIIATPEKGSLEKLYFDVQTGLLMRTDVVRESPQGKTSFEVYYDDYREVDGVKFPFVQRWTTPDYNATIKYDSVKHNTAIDDTKFSKPKPK